MKPVFECPYCGLVLMPTALVRPLRINGGVVCPDCYKTVLIERTNGQVAS